MSVTSTGLQHRDTRALDHQGFQLPHVKPSGFQPPAQKVKATGHLGSLPGHSKPWHVGEGYAHKGVKQARLCSARSQAEEQTDQALWAISTSYPSSVATSGPVLHRPCHTIRPQGAHLPLLCQRGHSQVFRPG